ncbi:FAD-binding protein [Litoreibacter ponti]|nr:FAD-binding protein [Litoreibacter ponti]
MTPESETALAELVRGANGPLRIVGGGTRPLGSSAGEVVSTSAISGIELYEPGALTLVAKAGTPMAEIEAALTAENQRLPFEPMDHRGLLGSSGTPTVGGVVAANVSGPRRVQAGACRDSLIGVRFVDGSGTVIKNGGRVMKNVTGYDLVKMMAGSYGTLGILTEVAFKVLPGIEASATLTLGGLDAQAAVGAMSKALGSPFEVSGAAYDPAKKEVYLRLEGFTASVAYRAEQLTDLLGAGDLTSDKDASDALWANIRDVAPLHGAEGDLWRVSVKPSDGPNVLEAIQPIAALLDWGGGLLWLATERGTDVRAKMDAIQGHATCLRGDGATFHPEPTPLAAISKGLRAQFDPRGILNPVLMG